MLRVMAPLRNPRWERFARLRAEGKPASTAYELAGYRHDYGNAIRLTGNDKVETRTGELMAKTGKRHKISVDSLCDELDLAIERALEANQPAVLVSVSALKARLAGLDRQRLEITEGGAYADCATVAAILAKVVSEAEGVDDLRRQLDAVEQIRNALIEALAAHAELIGTDDQ
jgi:hypothetical protein